MNQLDRIAREWLAAVTVIETALRDWGAEPRQARGRAEAIIARLAAHKPPILLEMQDEPQPGEPDKGGDRQGPRHEKGARHGGRAGDF